MPTLTLDGSVGFSSEVDRRELVRLAPAYEVDVLMNRARSYILVGEVHEVNFTDLPNNQATNLLLSVSEGSVTVNIVDSAAGASEFSLTPSGIIIMMNAIITDITITGVADSSVYDLIAAGKA